MDFPLVVRPLWDPFTVDSSVGSPPPWPLWPLLLFYWGPIQYIQLVISIHSTALSCCSIQGCSTWGDEDTIPVFVLIGSGLWLDDPLCPPSCMGHILVFIFLEDIADLLVISPDFLIPWIPVNVIKEQLILMASSADELSSCLISGVSLSYLLPVSGLAIMRYLHGSPSFQLNLMHSPEW